MTNATTDRVVAIFQRILDVPSDVITLELARGSVPQWDSLRQLELLMEIEAAFGVSFSLDEALRLKTVADFVEGVARRGAA